VKYRLSQHAQDYMARRSISAALVDAALQNPQQIVSDRHGNTVCQSQVSSGGGKAFRLRVVLNTTVDPPLVITVYRTAQAGRYGRS
jgi:hypothetical protein